MPSPGQGMPGSRVHGWKRALPSLAPGFMRYIPVPHPLGAARANRLSCRFVRHKSVRTGFAFTGMNPRRNNAQSDIYSFAHNALRPPMVSIHLSLSAWIQPGRCVAHTCPFVFPSVAAVRRLTALSYRGVAAASGVTPSCDMQYRDLLEFEPGVRTKSQKVRAYGNEVDDAQKSVLCK
jgi:hypothetical protein